MALTKENFTAYIEQFNFRELFNEMGWNNDKTTQSVIIDNISYQLQSIAVKSGFKILICNPTKEGAIPDYLTRKKIETKITKLFQEHLIIFIDAKKQEQIWQLVIRQTGKPTKVTETRYHISQSPELLFQRAAGIFFEMDEEEKITIVDVTQRVAENFHQNNEKVTKQFYESFKKEHTSFLAFIKGIEGKADKDWYASLMLNRLMFCYFIQKKGFLDKNKNYLRDKLKLCTSKNGKDKFYSFYRSFLLVLFHEGLNEPVQKEKIKIEIGKIPYLNGGLFDEHELEKSYDIDIDDKAFIRIFDFFDQYEWHLDTRTKATGKDINPDVIGYIFEKYINDRAQMGAYYTKEDITDYISKNCIIPWLFDETAKNYTKAFSSKGKIWKALQESEDTYIYNAVKHGTEIELPKAVQAGVKDVPKRTEWNKQATPDLGLPTELWREVIERRNRYDQIRKKIESGEITAMNDFITYNLNIRQFTQDVIENSDDPDFIRAFYKSLNSVTIIDPTCGSGAFLFAAMNILEPLYHACIMRMRTFTEDEDRKNELEKKTFSNKFKDLRKILENIQSEQHPNLQYFIYKSIILNNLYGVDIMREAVEIAKLRLFLKLVATVEADYKKKNLGLEPLPDVDFNIRAGNSLIGFATQIELNKGLRYTLDGVAAAPVIEEKCDIVAKAFTRYKEIQLSYGDDYKEFKKAKEILNKRLKQLNSELNKLLHKQSEGLKYEKWLESHQPFHWFAEFYEIIHDKKGFDIIIGNPPYVEYSKVDYELKNYETIKCGNLYAFVAENCIRLLSPNGRMGMIVQNSIVCTKRMLPIQKLFRKSFSVYYSNFDDRPAKLFTGIHHMKGTIFITVPDKSKSIYTTKFYRWYEEFRDFVFDSINYCQLPSKLVFEGHIPKLSEETHATILNKIYKQKQLGLSLTNNGKKVYCHRIASYFIKSVDFVPYFYNEKVGEKKSDDYKEYFVANEDQQHILMGLFNSGIFYLNWHTLHDGYHCGKKNIDEYPFEFPASNTPMVLNLIKSSKQIAKDYKKNAFRKETFYKNTGVVIYDEFYPKMSKNLIDELDFVLADHYSFTKNELDFVVNYDIKFRLGKDLENDEEE